MLALIGKQKKVRTRIIGLLVAAICLYVILPQIKGFDKSLAAVRAADFSEVAVSALVIFGSYFFAALTYYFLASKPLGYTRTVVLEFAATFINRLLPAGIGGMGVNFAYLRRNGHSSGAAGSIVAVNNLLGFVGHMILLAVIYASLGGHLPVKLNLPSGTVVIAVLFVVLLTTIVVIRSALQTKMKSLFSQIVTQFRLYRKRPRKLVLGLVSSMCLTLTVALCFVLCANATGVHLAFSTFFIVFTLGFAIGNAAPTPGGLGGVEAGLLLGLVVYDVPQPRALAAVLVFRLVSFWLTTLVGAVAFAYAYKRKYL